MRLIVRNRFPLHVWTVSDYIKQTQANLYKQDTSRFITMQNIFRKLYLRHLDDHQQMQVHQKNMNNLVLMGQAPAHAVADYFHKKAKVYSQDFMTATLKSIARAYHISKVDNGGTLDTLGYKLFLTAQFSNLSEQLKYAIRNNKVSFSNLVSIMKSLLQMQYVDYEIMNLLILYTQRQIDGGSQNQLLTQWKGDRQFQIEKKDYYHPHEIDILRELREGNEITTALSFIRHIYQEWCQDQQQKTDLKNQQIPEINRLIKEISTTNKNFRQIVEAILNVRKQYVKMVNFSENQKILRNPSLNLELLELEEKLIAIKVLSIEDIKHIKYMSNPEYEVKRVEQIILAVLDIHKLDPLFTFIDKGEIEVRNPKDSLAPNPTKVFTLLNFLSKFAALDRFVYHTADGRSLISLKWQKTLIEQQPGMKINDGPLYEQLNVSRIYRRVYSDIISLFSRNQQQLQSIFKKSDVNDKVQLLDAYCRMGLTEQAILNIADLQNEETQFNVYSLGFSKFLNFVHLMNDVAILINNPSLKRSVFNKLSQILILQQTNQITLSLRSTIDAINYLLQNHLQDQQFISVYRRFIDRLQVKSVYFPNEQQDNDNVVEAFKILALQIPDKYNLHPIYMSFLHKTVNDSYKKNPYLSILREAGFKWANKIKSLHQMHPYLNLGMNNGRLNGLVFSNSDETNLDGQIRSGDLNSYIFRLQQIHHVKINLFPINSFLTINFQTQQENHFQLKSIDLLQFRLQELFQQKNEEFVDLFLLLRELLKMLQKYYPQQLIAKRIEFKVAVLDKLRKHNPSIETKQQQFTNKAQFLLQVFELNKLVQLLTVENAAKRVRLQPRAKYSLNRKQKPLNQLEQVWQARTSEKQIQQLIQNSKQMIIQLIASLERYLTSQSLKRKLKPGVIDLKGKRQTLELLEQQVSLMNSLDVAGEFINYKYFNDKTYCEYQDWNNKIQLNYRIVELSYNKMTNLSRILINKFCGGFTSKITLMPISGHGSRIKRLGLKFRLIKQQPSSKTPLNNLQERKSNEQLKYIINLQNFKHELKTTFSPKELLNFIFSFKFIANLDDETQNRMETLLRRQPKEYFSYLQKLSERQYLQSPYAKYIIKKLSKTDKIRRLLQTRKIVRINQKILFQKGKINSTIYYKRINQIQKRIISAIRSLKTKMLDNMENKLIKGELKMVHIHKEELETFEDIIRRQFAYSRYFDQDFITANGNYALAINLKRNRAQNNFIKFHLLKKVAQKKSLTYQQKNLMKQWYKDIEENITSFQIYPEFTRLKISDLSQEDLSLLRLKSSALNKSKDMLLIDLILELNHFLDESVIHNYERQIKAELIHQKYHIPVELFQKSGNSQFKQLQIEAEKSIINQKSVLSQQQLDTLEQMFKTFKTQGYKERNRYDILCNNFKENITQMNNQSLRSQFIQEYVQHLESQFFKEYNPLLIADIKKRETDKLWKEVFHYPYDSCHRNLLKAITQKLIIRLQIVGKNSPPFFGNLLLNLIMHPNLDPLSRENLIAAIAVYNFDMNLDSQDILRLFNHPGSELRQSSIPKQELRAASMLNMGKLLKNRAASLL